MTTYDLPDEQVRVIVSALHDYRMESKRYIQSSGFRPCHTECTHCATRVEMHASIQADLQKRYDDTVAALTSFDEGPCQCNDSMRGEHWKGDHK